jgi:hypothetical protein
MNALKRFYVFGADAADRRVAKVLQPPAPGATDRYLKESAFVTAVDRITLHLQEWWLGSEASRLVASLRPRASQEVAVCHRAVALMILIAVIVHVGLTLALGAHTGWFWLIIPAMAVLFATGVLAGSNSTD